MLWIFDGLVVFFILLLGYNGFKKGLIEELGRLLGLVVAILLSISQSTFVSIKIDQFFKESYYWLGKSLVSLDKWFEAIHYFKKAHKLNNENVDYIKSLAFAEYKVGNMVSSVDLYTKALEINPADFKTSLEFSLIYYESGDIEKAINIIKEGIVEVPEESLLYYRLVIYLMDSGRYKESMNVLESALSLNFDNHEVLFDFVPNFETQSALIRIINQFRNNNLK